MTSVCGGFVYAASLMGITGARAYVDSHAEALVRRVRQHTTLPVAVGLGVRDGKQAAQVAGFADGVIVGSAFVQRLLDADSPDAGIASVRELASELASGVREGPAARAGRLARPHRASVTDRRPSWGHDRQLTPPCLPAAAAPQIQL